MMDPGWRKVAGIMTTTFPEEAFDAKGCKNSWSRLVVNSRVVVENGAWVKRFLPGF